MLLAISFVLMTQLSFAQPIVTNMQGSSPNDPACASYLVRAHALLASPSSPAVVSAYLKESREHLLRGGPEFAEHTRRFKTILSLQSIWEKRISAELVRSGLVPHPISAPWYLERQRALKHLPHLARFFPYGYQLIFDPFDLLEDGAGAIVSNDRARLHLPLEILDETKPLIAEFYLAHELVHVRLKNHILSRFFIIDPNIAESENVSHVYQLQLSTEEIFAFTVDLISLLEYEKSGGPILIRSGHREQDLRQLLEFYLSTLRPIVMKEAGAGVINADGTYRLADAPLMVVIKNGDAAETLPRHLRSESDAMAEACRALLAILDASGDRVPRLQQFLRAHGLDPDEFKIIF